MFRKRKTAPASSAAGPVPDDRPDAVAYRRWYGPTRALTTLIGAAAAVLLIWTATQVGADDSNGAYWAAFGLVALAGVVMAFSQVVGGWTKFGVPRMSGNVLLIAFVPTLVVGGWVLLAHQPDSGLFRNDIRGWSDDIGLLGVVMDFEQFLPALAFLVGLTFGLSFDTSGPRTHPGAARERGVAARRAEGPAAVPAAQPRYTEEPTTAERRETETQVDRGRSRLGRRRQREEAYSGTPAAPQPEPPPRRSDDLE